MSCAAEEMSFETGRSVWVPCAQQGFKEVTIVEAADDHLVVTDPHRRPAGTTETVCRTDARPFFRSDLQFGCDDNTSLVHLDDANILENLRLRFTVDKIYTYTANVLLAVNPYRNIPGLYTDDMIKAYRGKSIGVMPPHPYAIADTAYRYLLRERCDQALVISGESGAGKTETAKTTMRYLTSVSRTDATHGGHIQERIVTANPILESFGNASTVRNRNSSRFGKYNQMYFNQVGSLVGAGIKTYLLESSRVVLQQSGEQNYHVFYEMLAGVAAERLAALHLDPSQKYRLLYPGSAQPLSQNSPDGQSQLRHRKQQFEELQRALGVVGVDSVTEADIWNAVAALIHLGEIDFMDSADETASPLACDSPAANRSPRQAPEEYTRDSDESSVEIGHQHHLEHAAALLGLVDRELQEVLTTKTRHVRGQDIPCPRSKRQAFQTLQSVAKILYQRLFDRVLACINEASSVGGSCKVPEGCLHIGTLDIYGFERLNTNALEQLCINLANEKLQQFFVEKVLKAEQDIYAEESLKIPSYDLPSCDPVVSVVKGVFTVLDEYSIKSMRNLCGSDTDRKFNDPDQKFCEHVHATLINVRRSEDNPLQAIKMSASRASRHGSHTQGRYDGFQIQHYAGVVQYSTAGWIEKNNDALMPEVEALLSRSSRPLVASLANKEGIDACAGEKAHSVTKKYLGHLDKLLETLAQCNVHYIRCFNPNQRREAARFEPKYVLDQIIQCGTVPLVNIMHFGYPHRCTLHELRTRFSGLLPEDMVKHYSDRDFVMAIMLAFDVQGSEWTLGTRRLFLKAGKLRVLESLRDDGVVATRDVILKIRKFIARKKVRAACTAIHLMKWLPGQVMQLRKRRLAFKLRKAVFVFVRLHRWLAKARSNLGMQTTSPVLVYKTAAPQPPAPAPLISFIMVPKSRGLCLRSAGAGIPQLFIALNSYEKPNYASILQTEVNNSHAVHDMTLRQWQYWTTESVLLYDGLRVFSARFCAKACLRQFPMTHDKVNAGFEPILSDVRLVDVHDSGLAEPVQLHAGLSDIVAMCQHKKRTSMFATCDASNTVIVWEWIGTDSHDPSKRALKPFYFHAIGENWTVFNMCFLHQEPPRAHVSGTQSSTAPVVLLILTAHVDSTEFMIRMVSFTPGDDVVECTEFVEVNEDVLTHFQETSAEVPIFSMSNTGRILVVGGAGILQFWEVHAGPCGRGYGLTLVEDAASTLLDISQSTLVSCQPIPRGGRSNGHSCDWLTIGDARGNLYGFSFDVPPQGRVRLHEQGRFRTNRHDPGMPVTVLMPSYGTTQDTHYRAVQEQGVSYSAFLDSAVEESRRFYSLGCNGKLLTWKMSDEGGWACSQDEFLPADGQDSDARRFVAGRSSRLVPQLLVAADQHRQCIYAYDAVKGSSAEPPPGSMCSYALA